MCLQCFDTVGWVSEKASGLEKLSDEVYRVGVVICLQRCADCLHMVQLMPLPSQNPIISCLNQIQTGFTFLVPGLTQVVLEKRLLNGCSSSSCKKGKGSPYSITEHWVPELIPVLGSQPAGDVSHKPGGRLPLLSARLPSQPLRGLRPILLLGEQRHNGCEQFA